MEVALLRSEPIRRGERGVTLVETLVALLILSLVALSILQIFFLLLFLLSIKLGVELGGTFLSRVFESVTAALVGITGSWAWSYAIKDRRLMLPEVTDSYARELQDRILAEPITATLTILLAFAGPIVWEVGWFSYPIFVILIRRRREGRKSVG